MAGAYDDRELWEVAAMLGANRDDDTDEGEVRREIADPRDFLAG